MDFSKIFSAKGGSAFGGKSKAFKIIFGCFAGLVLILVGIKLGLEVGYRKADFSHRWGENYRQNFAGPRSGFFKDLADKDFMNGHGLFGQIIKIDGQTLIIKGQDNVEKIVLVKDDTVIRHLQDNLKITDLKVNDNVTVIGNPNNSGQIEAKLIRLLPPPPAASQSPVNFLPPPAGTGRGV